MNQQYKISLFLLPLLLSACAVGPDYVRPPVKVTAKFKEAKGRGVITSNNKQWKKARPSDIFDRGRWWEIFHDAKLNGLEVKLNAANQSLWNAYENYKQARAIVDEGLASFYPTFTGDVTVTRQKGGGGASSFVSTSSTGTTSTGTASTGGNTTGTPTTGNGVTTTTSAGRITTMHTVLFNASWEPDIWGLVRRQVEADASAAQASAALYAATRLSLQASLATYYFELRGLDNDQRILDETVRADRKILQFVRNQYRAGVAARSDILQAQGVMETAQGLAINNHILRAQYEHAIAVLIGEPPAAFALAARPLHASPPPIPVSVPSVLLERRPDIAQAERLMEQANALIGVAVAAYYPTITLTGTASVTGSGLAHWFSLPALAWAYGPQISELIFDGGLRSATVRAARAQYYASVANYRQVVLSAFQDVEDNLVALKTLNDETRVLNQAAASASLALKLIVNQYRSGIVAYNTVLTAQTTALSAEKSASDANYLRMASAVGLVRSLGGGWNAGLVCDAAYCGK